MPKKDEAPLGDENASFRDAIRGLRGEPPKPEPSTGGLLSEEDRARIRAEEEQKAKRRAEEEYRAHVAASLTAPPASPAHEPSDERAALKEEPAPSPTASKAVNTPGVAPSGGNVARPKAARPPSPSNPATSTGRGCGGTLILAALALVALGLFAGFLRDMDLPASWSMRARSFLVFLGAIVFLVGMFLHPGDRQRVRLYLFGWFALGGAGFALAALFPPSPQLVQLRQQAEAAADARQALEAAEDEAAAAIRASEAERLKTIDDDTMMIGCETLVKRNLKSPGTARFSGILEKAETRVQDTGNGNRRYRSWVDSQNAFGALLRTNFTCTYTKASDTLRVQLDE